MLSEVVAPWLRFRGLQYFQRFINRSECTCSFMSPALTFGWASHPFSTSTRSRWAQGFGRGVSEWSGRVGFTALLSMFMGHSWTLRLCGFGDWFRGFLE